MPIRPLEHDHTPDAISARLAAGVRHNYLRDFVYGGIDGAVTTFAVVAGVTGAELSPAIVLVLGVANLIADGFSMAAGNYLGTRAEQDDLKHLAAREHRHIELAPDGEREEVRQIYAGKGFAGEDLERVVALITAERERWVDTMLVEEYGLPLEVRSPVLAAATTFGAFLLCGLAPLIPFVFGAERPFAAATLTTCVVFFLIGSIKAKWSITAWWKSGLTTLAIGAAAASLSYAVGVLLKGIAG